MRKELDDQWKQRVLANRVVQRRSEDKTGEGSIQVRAYLRC